MSVGREITPLARSRLPSEVRATAPNPDVTLADRAACIQSNSIVVFADITPQTEQLLPNEMLKALELLKSRLRSETPENREELALQHA